jgi:16S rRNA processing protein RimM
MARSADAIVVMGEVLGPYGIRGWLKVRSFAESPGALLDYPTWWLKPARGAAWSEFRRQDGRLHSGALVAALGGVGTREAALAMKGFEIGVPRATLPAAAEGEFYWDDLSGLAVLNRSGALLGEVVGVTQHGAHPLLRVARPSAMPGPERLIPFVAAIIDRVDIDAGRIEVDWGVDY